MRPECIILNESGRLPTEYGPLKMPDAQLLNTNGKEGFVCYMYFFTNKGPAIQIPVPKGRTVVGKFYKKRCFEKIEELLQKSPPQNRTYM